MSLRDGPLLPPMDDVQPDLSLSQLPPRSSDTRLDPEEHMGSVP